jgi:hypothetical protein
MNRRLQIAALVICMFPTLAFAQINSIYTLHPKAKAAFLHVGMQAFILSKTTPIVAPDQPSMQTAYAIAYFETLVKKAIGDTLQVFPAGSIGSSGPAIYIGEASSNPALAKLLPGAVPSESTPDSSGYVLDVRPTQIILAGSTPDGTFNGITTLVQLWNVTGSTATIAACDIWDQPDYPIRGVMGLQNLLVNSQDSMVKALDDQMASHKMNTLMQGDFKYGILDIMQKLGLNNYFTNAASVQQYGFAHNIDLIPMMIDMGWSSATLYHDPNLAEGFPANARYVMQNDTGRIVPDPNMTIPNSGFENYTGNHFGGWSYYDGDGSFTTVDNTTYHSGSASAKCTNPNANCRFEKTVTCQPWHAYILSCWIKTSNFSGGSPELLALAFYGSNGSQGLTSTSFTVDGTSAGWTKIQVAFNTLQYSQVGLYVGVWGGFSGTMWFDDFQVQDMGLVNVLRRGGTPLWVKNHTDGKIYTEGGDFAPIVDSTMLKNLGEYPIDHAPAPFVRLSSGTLHNGDTADVSYSTALCTDNYDNGDGKMMACVSEDSLYSIINDQVTRIEALYHPKSYFMSHDEIRELGWDSACLNRKLSAAALLADNATHCYNIINQIHPNADVMVWSDMFDSLHNAHNNYYLVNGDLTGDWWSIPKNLTIVNWNGGANMTASLDKFSQMGFRQISSPYYDVQNTTNMRNWRIAQEGTPRIRGMMYTTWQSDFSFLTQFGDYAWGIAPYIYHTPLDSTALLTLHGQQGNIPIAAEILPDLYDPTDTIASATLTYWGSLDTTTIVPLTRDTGNSWVGMLNASGERLQHFWYEIASVDKNGIHRTTPTYEVRLATASVVQKLTPKQYAISIFPNPASEVSTLHLSSRQAGPTMVQIFDALGRQVLESITTSSGSLEIKLDLHTLTNGVYDVSVKSGRDDIHTSVVVAR